MEIVIRAGIMYLFLWCLLRAMGRRELSELTTFDLLLTVVIGDLIQQGVTQEDMSFTGAVLAVGTIAMLALGVSLLGFQSRRLEGVLDGVPIVLARDGEVYVDALRRERITHGELIEAARGKGIVSLDDVHLVVLEPDGQFSFLGGQA